MSKQSFILHICPLVLFQWLKYFLLTDLKWHKWYNISCQNKMSHWSYLLFASCHMSAHSVSLPLYCHMSSCVCANCPCGFMVVIQRRLVDSVGLLVIAVRALLTCRGEVALWLWFTQPASACSGKLIIHPSNWPLVFRQTIFSGDFKQRVEVLE